MLYDISIPRKNVPRRTDRGILTRSRFLSGSIGRCTKREEEDPARRPPAAWTFFLCIINKSIQKPDPNPPFVIFAYTHTSMEGGMGWDMG